MNKFIVDDSVSRLTLHENGVDMKVGLKSIDFNSRIKDKIWGFHVNEHFSFSIDNTYVIFHGTLDKKQKRFQFETLIGEIDKELLRRMKVKFNGPMANVVYHIAQYFFSDLIEEKFIEPIVRNSKDLVNNAIINVLNNRNNFTLHRVSFKYKVKP